MLRCTDNNASKLVLALLVMVPLPTESFLTKCTTDADCIPPEARVCAFNCLLNYTTCFRTKSYGERCLVSEQCLRTDSNLDCSFEVACKARLCKCRQELKFDKTSGNCVERDFCYTDSDCAQKRSKDIYCLKYRCHKRTILPGPVESNTITVLPTHMAEQVTNDNSSPCLLFFWTFSVTLLVSLILLF